MLDKYDWTTPAGTLRAIEELAEQQERLEERERRLDAQEARLVAVQESLLALLHRNLNS